MTAMTESTMHAVKQLNESIHTARGIGQRLNIGDYARLGMI